MARELTNTAIEAHEADTSRVLVVDDEAFFRDAIGDVLGLAGVLHTAVATGDEALKAVEDPRFGVAVLDLRLPDVDALEVLRQIRSLRPTLSVVVLSAASDQELVLEALRIGACDYLAKPLHEEELVLAVRRALDAHAAEAGFAALRSRLDILSVELADLVEFAAREPDEREELHQRIALAVAEVSGASRTSLMLREGDVPVLRVAAAVGSALAPEEMDVVCLGDPVAGLAWASGEVMVATEFERDERLADRTARSHYRQESFVVAPLELVPGEEGPRPGVVCATERPDGTPFSDDDRLVMRILALAVSQLLFGAEAGTHAGSAQVAAAATAEPEAIPAGDDDPGVARQAAESDAELARAVCEAITSEIEPARLIEAALEPVARLTGAAPVSLYLIEPVRSDLGLEGQIPGDTEGDRPSLSRTQGLTSTVLQTGNLVATEHPEIDPRFSPEFDTAADGVPRALLCVPLKLRGKVLGIARIFGEVGAVPSVRTGEILSSVLSAAVRNVLLYRSLLESIDEVAKARQGRQAQ